MASSSVHYKAGLLALLVAAALVASAQAQVCTSQLNNLNVCAPFVVPGTSNTQPSTECCSALQAVDHDCICSTLRIASRLPALCNVPQLSCSSN